MHKRLRRSVKFNSNLKHCSNVLQIEQLFSPSKSRASLIFNMYHRPSFKTHLAAKIAFVDYIYCVKSRLTLRYSRVGLNYTSDHNTVTSNLQMIACLQIAEPVVDLKYQQ